MDLVWKTVAIVVVSIVFLRLAGRKSLAQMTPSTVTVMIMLGAVMAGPLSSHSVITTLCVIAGSLVILYLLEWLQLRSKTLARVLSGQAIDVIIDGAVLPEQLRKARITEDKLEMRLRMAGISQIADVKKATIEISGDLGYELYPDAKPMTIRDWKRLMGEPEE
ncbi:MAG: DUF421 domain-containing protein [Firmicutes bacterium]|nr:DUF421 domain-containing protein [Bacillota bacterium]